jgi:RNA polymerase sigma factor (sigma-70 family)
LPTSDVNRTIDAVWRIESARLIAGLARIVRDVGLAEDLAQEALVAALEQWPESGVPDNPGAWLMGTGRHRAIDRLRRADVHERKTQELGRVMEVRGEVERHDLEAEIDDPFDDDLLRLIFTTCHPALSTDARVALTLRLLGGLTTKEIARAHLVSESTIAQRIVRAKRTLSAARVPFEVPEHDELADRLASVLEVIYLVFNEGYAATAGDELIRPELIEEALRLGRILAELLPSEPEVHGLVALMELQASRSRARTGPSGEPVLLLDQDRSRWDWMLVGRGLAALERAQSTGGALGPYTLQATIAACHARVRLAGDTDWERIVALYDALAQLTPSPVVELNRAVAVGMAFGPEAALELVDALSSEPALCAYHLLPSVRGDLLAKLGRYEEARREFGHAASLTQNAHERAVLLERIAGLSIFASLARRIGRAHMTAHRKESTMSVKYALVYFFDPSETGPTESEYQEWVEFEKAAKDAGHLVHGAGLYPSSEAKSIRIRDGQAAVQEGAPTGEAVAGYYLVEVPDEDTAVSWAQRVPTARYGRVEVRQITEMA